MKLILLLIALSIQVLYAQQGIKGKVEWISGNQMPGPDKPTSKAKPIVREIFFYEATSIEQAISESGVFFSNITTKLVKTVTSKKNGNFCVKLPPGTYSIFVKEPSGLYANAFDTNACIQCVTVRPKEYTQQFILVNYEAAY